MYILDNLISLPFCKVNFGLCVCELVTKAKNPFDLVYRMYITIYSHTDGHKLFYSCVKNYDVCKSMKKYYMKIVVILLHDD